MALLLATCLAVPPAARAAPRAAEELVYYVRPLGEVDPAQTAYACRVIRDVFRVRCQVLRPRALPAQAFDRRRNQYDADLLVGLLFDDLPRDAVGLMGVTDADLFDPHRTRFVFGLASLVDHVGVVSLARYRGTWWGDLPDPIQFRERFYKVLVHEVGHTLGLSHCPDRRCVMRDDRTLGDLDDSPHRFCPRCQRAAREGLNHGPGSARWHYMRGHSHLNRGQVPQAVFHFERTAELDPRNPLVINDLGVAYLRRGDAARALWYFREARQLDPAFANAPYNEGLVFLSVGDVEMARQAFELTLAVDPRWGPAHRQLGYLFQESIGDEARALGHFQAYLEDHGDDASVRDRVRLIKGGGRATTPP